MILVRRWVYIFLAAVVCLGILGSGILGYISIHTAAAGSAEHGRFVAEEFLFISAVAAVLLLLVFIIIIIRSIRINRELDKVIELNRFQDFSPEKSMKKLGSLGERITALYYQLNTLNEKKSLKISAQSALTGFLVGNLDLPLVICDVSGTVLWVSTKLTDKLGKTKTEVSGGTVESVFPDISLQTILFELGKTHASLDKTTGKNALTCYPIHNRLNEISYIVFVLGGKAVFPAVEKAPEPRNHAQSNRLQKTLHRLLNRR